MRSPLIAYVVLFFAVIAEIIATSALKISDGLTKLSSSLVVVGGYSIAFYLMSISLKTLPVSVVYALWCGLGIVGVACIGIFYFGESVGLWHYLGFLLILVGTIILSLVTEIP